MPSSGWQDAPVWAQICRLPARQTGDLGINQLGPSGSCSPKRHWLGPPTGSGRPAAAAARRPIRLAACLRHPSDGNPAGRGLAPAQTQSHGRPLLPARFRRGSEVASAARWRADWPAGKLAALPVSWPTSSRTSSPTSWPNGARFECACLELLAARLLLLLLFWPLSSLPLQLSSSFGSDFPLARTNGGGKRGPNLIGLQSVLAGTLRASSFWSCSSALLQTVCAAPSLHCSQSAPLLVCARTHTRRTN